MEDEMSDGYSEISGYSGATDGQDNVAEGRPSRTATEYYGGATGSAMAGAGGISPYEGAGGTGGVPDFGTLPTIDDVNRRIRESERQLAQQRYLANVPPTILLKEVCSRNVHYFACKHEERCKCGDVHRVVMPDGI